MTTRIIKLAALAALGVSPLLFLGCASNEHNVVPASAMMLNDAHGDITVTAPHNGTVYVYDKNTDTLVYSGKVNHDDVVKLDDNSQNININDRVVENKTLNSNDEYQVYFDRDHGDEARNATYVEPNGNTTVVTHDDSGTHQTTVVTPDNNNQ